MKELIEIGLAIGAVIIGALIITAILTWNEIKSWFQERSSRIDNKDHVARTIQDKLANGHYKTIYGIYDKKNEDWIEQKSVESKSIDQELERFHARERIVDHYI